MNRFLLSLGLLAALLPPWVAGSTENIVSAASLTNGLDALGGSARALALGSAYVAVPGDSSSVFWNPSGLASLDSAQISLHHNSWLPGVNQETLVLALPTVPFGGFGLTASYLDEGVFQQRDSTGNVTGSYSANRLGLGLSWGKNCLPNLAFGLAAKYTLQDAPGSSVGNFAADLGLTWSPTEHLSLGLAWMNWGTYYQGAPTAEAVRAGISYSFSTDPTAQTLLAAAYAFQPYGADRVEGGLEEVIHSFLAFRVGYVLSLQDNQLGGLSGLTAGLGFRFNGLDLDYAYLPVGDLATTHRISLSYSFGAVKRPAPTATPLDIPKAASPTSTVTPSSTPNLVPTPIPTVEAEKLEIFFALPESQAAPDAQANTQTAADVQKYLAVIKQNPDDSHAWLLLGIQYAHSHKIQRAIQCFQQTLRLEPDSATAKTWLKWAQKQEQ